MQELERFKKGKIFKNNFFFNSRSLVIRPTHVVCSLRW